MFNFLHDPSMLPYLYIFGVFCGVLAKRYVYDILRGYIINKLKPGIIQTYLEEMLGINQTGQPLPPVMILPVKTTPPLTPVTPVPMTSIQPINNPVESAPVQLQPLQEVLQGIEDGIVVSQPVDPQVPVNPTGE